MGGYSNTFKKSLRLTSALGMSMFSAVLPMMVGNSIPLMVCSVLLSCGASYNLGNTLINVLVGRSLSSKEKERIDQALEDLKTIPFMQPIMQNLPQGIEYAVMDEKEDKIITGMYDIPENKIIINPRLLNYTTSKEKLKLYVMLAHELCHASQKKEGVLFGDLISPSYRDTFCIVRMNEIEAESLDVLVENELLKRPEFCECSPSISCRCFQSELCRAKGNVTKARTAYVVSLWNNEGAQTEDERMWLSEYNECYVKRAHLIAILLKRDAKIKSSGVRTAEEAMRFMVQRMGMTGVEPEQFLQSEVDKVKSIEVYKDRGVRNVWQNSQGR